MFFTFAVKNSSSAVISFSSSFDCDCNLLLALLTDAQCGLGLQVFPLGVQSRQSSLKDQAVRWSNQTAATADMYNGTCTQPIPTVLPHHKADLSGCAFTFGLDDQPIHFPAAVPADASIPRWQRSFAKLCVLCSVDDEYGGGCKPVATAGFGDDDLGDSSRCTSTSDPARRQ